MQVSQPMERILFIGCLWQLYRQEENTWNLLMCLTMVLMYRARWDLLITIGLTCALLLLSSLLLICILIGFVIEMGPVPPPLYHFLSALYDQFHLSFIR